MHTHTQSGNVHWWFSKYAVHKKSLNKSKHCTWHHFLKMNCCRQCRQTQFLSTAGFGKKMKLKLRLPPFSLIHIWCQRVFCFQFWSLLPLSKFWYIIRWQTTHIGSLLIPCLGSCPVSIDLKLSLSSLARETTSGQFDRRPNRLFQIWVRFYFKY